MSMLKYNPEGEYLKKPGSVTALIALFVYFSNGAFPRNHISAGVRVILLVGLCIALFFIKGNNKIRLNAAHFVLLCAVIVMQGITILFHGISFEFDAFLALAIVAAFLYVSLIPFSDFIKSYRAVIFIIASISLVFYLLGLIIPNYVDYVPGFLLQETSVDNALTLLGTFVVRNKGQHTYYRNFGIFTEPGQYQIFLCIGLAIELWCVNKPNWKILAVILLAILTCESTNGYIVTVFLLGSYAMENKSAIFAVCRKYPKQLIIGASVVIFLIVLLGWNTIVSVFDKIIGLFTAESGTGFQRRRAFCTAIEIWLRHPLVGYGYSGMQAYVKSLSNTGFIMTCTPLNWFARFGTIYGFVVNSCFCAAFGMIPKSVGGRIMMIVSFLALISAQETGAGLVTWILIFYGCGKILGALRGKYQSNNLNLELVIEPMKLFKKNEKR